MADQAQPERELPVGATHPAIGDRLTHVETQLESLQASLATGREQKVLELETCELVVKRLMEWAKLFAFSVCIPIAILLVVAGVILGKNLKDLNDLAVTTRNALQPLLTQAHNSADEAQKVAKAAQEEADKVRNSVKPMSQDISDLQSQVTLGLQSVQELKNQMGEASDGLKQLRARVTESSEKVSQLGKQIEVVSNEKNLTDLRSFYPVFGERVAFASGIGPIDVQQKKHEDVYINLLVSLSPYIELSQRKVNEKDIAAAMTSLQSIPGYTVFTHNMALYVMTKSSSTTIDQTSPGNCSDMGGLPDGPPCILYFRRDLESVTKNIKQILTPAQAIPDERLRYVDPANTKPTMQELLEKSGLDIVIVLGQ